MTKKLTMRTWAKAGERIKRLTPGDRKRVFDALNAALDELREDDGFGTEGQLDPRGDGRED